jgi:hypothetical protein
MQMPTTLQIRFNWDLLIVTYADQRETPRDDRRQRASESSGAQIS